jgi:hypothetical protein
MNDPEPHETLSEGKASAEVKPTKSTANTDDAGVPTTTNKISPPKLDRLRPLAWMSLGIVLVIGLASLYVGPISLWNAVFDNSNRYLEPSRESPAALQEWQMARADHDIIAAAIAACSKIFNLSVQPNYIRAQLRLDVGPSGESVRLGNREERDLKLSANLILSNFHRAAIYLSDAIVRARTESARNASANIQACFGSSSLSWASGRLQRF